MSWWPVEEHGIWGYLRPLPAFAVSALPLMFAIDWYVFFDNIFFNFL